MEELREQENSYLSYIKDIKYYPLLDFQQEQRLAQKVQKGDKEAREKLIRSNLKLVIKIVMRYYNPRYDLMDLIQEGNIGLMTAVDKFDPGKRLRFSTYSTWWIRHYIIRSIIKREFQINIPLRKMQLLYRIERSIYKLFERFRRLPDIRELEQELNVKSKEIKDMLNYITPILSLDTPLNSENNQNLMDTIGSRDYHPEEIVFNHYLFDYELKIMKSLVKRDAEILKYRYGFHNGRYLTLKNVAKIFNITPEAVRQIEIKAFRKIRMQHKDLRNFLSN
jgi:RNA polymerase primary sigma factor